MKARHVTLALLAVLPLAACQMDQLLNAPGTPGPNTPGTPSAQAPLPPAALGQFRPDGSPVGSGSTIDEPGILIRARVEDPEPDDSVMLQLELRPDGTGFSGTPTHASARVASGAQAGITIETLADTLYRWQVRAVDRAGRTSAWVAFSTGGAFRVSVPKLPAAPVGLQQYHENNTPIPVGGTTSERDVFLEAGVADPRLTGDARVEFEVRSRDVAFTGSRTHRKDGIENGETARLKFQASAFVGYHWQARVCTEAGCSSWVEFGGNDQMATDFLRNPFDDD